MLGVTSRMTITAEGLEGMSLDVIVKILSFELSTFAFNGSVQLIDSSLSVNEGL
jgi:hypothetical protein